MFILVGREVNVGDRLRIGCCVDVGFVDFERSDLFVLFEVLGLEADHAGCPGIAEVFVGACVCDFVGRAGGDLALDAVGREFLVGCACWDGGGVGAALFAERPFGVYTERWP